MFSVSETEKSVAMMKAKAIAEQRRAEEIQVELLKALQNLNESQQKLHRMQEALDERLKELELRQKQWLTPDEAWEQVFQRQVPKSSRHHRERLSALYRVGVLTKKQGARPPKYCRKELENLAERVAAGDFQL